MALCPFADHELIPPGDNDPRIVPRLVILHVAVSVVESLYSFFRWRSGGIESHFYVTLLGRVKQYRDTGWQADANHTANNYAVSIETAGFGSGKWNRRQRRAIERLLLWLHETHEIPLRQVQHASGSGVGYHVMFGAPGPWTPVAKSCPGPARIRQFRSWLVPWMRAQRDHQAGDQAGATGGDVNDKQLRELVRSQWRTEELVRELVRESGRSPRRVLRKARRARKQRQREAA